MKILITGGIKSGKSLQAEKRIIEISNGQIPIYLATNELFDSEMKKRVSEHRNRRGNRFQTIEEALYLYDTINERKEPVLIECMTMWLNNALYKKFPEEKIFLEIKNLFTLKNDLIFVLNEVGLGIVPENNLAREFADLSGKVAQILADLCDEVNLCVAGRLLKLK